MAKQEPMEQYTPKGLKIPVPTRGEFDTNLDKLLKAPQTPARFKKPRSARKARTGEQ